MFRKRPFLSATIAATAVSFFCLVALEATLRRFPGLMSIQWQLRHDEIQAGNSFRVVPDADIGFLNSVTKDTDRHGFPNLEPWPAKASLVFLGDSLLSGTGVGLAGTFTQLIDRMLPDAPVVNLGIPGAGVERQYSVYRRFGGQLQPRTVVVCLYLAADFENDEHFTMWLREGRGTEYDHFRLAYARRQSAQDEYATPATLLRTFQFRRLLQKSYVYVRAGDLAGDMWGKPRPLDRYRFDDGSDVLLDVRKMRFAAAAAAANDPRIEALLASIDKVRALLANEGARLAIMLIPSKEELFGVPDESANHNVVARVRERLRAAHLPVLDLYPVLRSATLQAPYFSRDIHLTAYGNRIVAEEFVAFFNNHRRELGEE